MKTIEGLTLSALLIAAAVDSINPCTLAVLAMLITAIIISGNKKKALFSGLGFTGAIYISYFLMGLGLFSAIKATGITYIFYYAVTVLALIIAIANINSFFKYKPGFFSVEMPARWRPFLKKTIKKVTSVPGAIAIGFLCSLFLLPCSSGPYLILLGLLANNSTRLGAIPYLLLYNLIFILPMIIITLVIYLGITKIENISKWRNKNIKILHLVSGILMLLLAILLIISLILGWV